MVLTGRKNKKARALRYLGWSLYFAVAVDAVNIIMAFVYRQAALLMLPLSVLCTAFGIFLYWYQQTRLSGDILDIAQENAQMQHQILTDFPVPYGLMDENGRIMWANSLLRRLLKTDKNAHKPLWNLMDAVKEKDFPLSTDVYERHIHLDEKYYRLEIDNVPVPDEMISMDMIGAANSQGGLYTIYLFDETDEVLYRQEREDEQLVVGLIYMDNYDELLESIEEVRRSLLVALIDRKITRYVERMDGLIKKLDKDKYLILIKKKCVQQFKDDKFGLLEDVKTVDIGNDTAVTISIGLGLGSDSYNRNYEYARAAIDLALGRGGDQAVIREKDKISYYGGKTQQMEKNTRVKARMKAHALQELIASCDHVLIMGHSIGDVDSFGAAVGIRHIAVAMGKPASVVADDVSSSIRQMLDRVQAQTQKEGGEPLLISCSQARETVKPSTLIVVVDVNRPSRTECPDLLNCSCNVVVLDHHRQMEEQIEGAVLSYVEPYASSTCELVAEILQYVDEDNGISPSEAEIMYAGIVVDTNNFVNKAGVRTFEAAAFLRRCGADVVRVRKMLRENMEDYKARAAAVSQAEIFNESYAISVCPSEGVDNPTVACAQAANELLNIAGVKASFVLTLYNDTVYISARSIDEVNVQVIMERFGGGGHMTVAGAQMHDCSIEDAKELVKETVTNMAEEGDI